MLSRLWKFVIYSIFSLFLVTCLSSILSLEKQQKILHMPFDKTNENKKKFITNF